MDDFSQRLIRIESDLIDLKTAIPRTSSSTSGIWQSDGRLDSGKYQIEYYPGDFPVLSIIIASRDYISPKSPSGNTQVFELLSRSTVRIISNRKIVSVSPI